MYVQALGFEDSLCFVLHILNSRMWVVKLLIHCSQLVFVADEQYLSFFLFFSLSFLNSLYIAVVSVFTEVISSD